jgi:ABC-type transport system involved in cytochrome c biogenesis permease subunit
MAYPGELVEPVVVAPTVVGGNIAVQQLTISSSGSFTALPVPVIVEETLGTTSNVKIINDAHYLHTFDGTRYRWIHRGMTSWTGGSIPVAYLDTI